MGKKNQKNFFVLKINAFESWTRNSHNPKRDTSLWQSMCYETLLRLNISLRKILCKSGSFRVMKKYEKVTLMQFIQEFGTL